MWPFGKSTAERVKEALNAQPRLQELNLDVQERGGTVRVSGNVPNDRYGQLVQVVAQGISGVNSVDVSGLVAPAAATTEVQASAETESPSAATASSDTASSDTASSDTASIEQGIQQAVDSSALAKQAYHAIRNNGELANNPIDVLQSGSSIILRGAVDSDHEQRLAEQLTREVSGVSAVDVSGLKVVPNVKELTQQKDAGSGDVTYTIQAGDTLSGVAQRYFGDEMRYKDIAHYNNISDPDHIEVGQTIRIPSA